MCAQPVSSYLNSLAPIGKSAGTGSSGSLGPFAALPSTASTAIFNDALRVADTAAKTTDKGYRALVSRLNVTTYSILSKLHSCPRAFALDKIKAVRELNAHVPEPKIIDFVYGHSVGAGVQGLMASGNDLKEGLLAQFFGWKGDFFFGDEDKYERKNKTIGTAGYAIMQFHELLKSHEVLRHYDIVDVVVRGVKKPAVELTFFLDCQNGYHYYGHVDVIVRNRISGQIAVLEIKTDGRKVIEPAAYSNSDQALGYAVLLDSAFPGLTSFDVIYCVWMPVAERWEVLQFAKSVKKKAEWIQSLLLDHATIGQYKQLKFYPKRGASCMEFNRRCNWYGECDFVQPATLDRILWAENDERVEDIDFEFTLDQVIAAQKEQIK